MGGLDLRAGTRVGGYVLQRPLGQGGMGVVWLAEDAAGRPAAVKLLRPDWDHAPDPEQAARAQARFEREIQASLALRHPHLVGFLDAGEEQGVPWIALEYCPGGSLHEHLRGAGGRLPWRDAARVGIGVAEALAALHAAGLVHRDVKPRNLLLDGAGQVRLADLGLVRRPVGSSSQALTRSGELVGTLEYMAPEQADGVAVDERADLYALGCTLFALLTGAPPFQGPAVQLLHQHLQAAPPALRGLAPGVPPGLEALVATLLKKDPAQRGPGAARVAAQLRELLAPGAASRLPWWLSGLLLAGGLLAAAGLLLARPRRAPAPPLVPPPPPVAPPELLARGQLVFLRRSPRRHEAPVRALLLAEGGVLTAAADGSLLRWESGADAGEAPALRGVPPARIACGARGERGELYLAAGGRILELDRRGRAGAVALEPRIPGEPTPGIAALARHGEEWLLGLDSGRVVLLGADGAPQLLEPALHAAPLLAAYLPDGRRLVVRPDAAYAFDRDEPRNHVDLVADEAPFTAAALHPSGRELLVADGRGHAGLMSLGGELSPLPPPLHAAAISAAAFHPDGRRCLTADADGRVLLSRVDRQASIDAERVPFEPVGEARLEGDHVTRAAFSGDGARVWLGTARGALIALEVAPD